MKLLLTLLLALSFCFSQAQNQNIEKALSAVVTVVVTQSMPIGKKIIGVRGDITEEAYRRSLALTDAIGSGSGFIIRRNGKSYIVTNAHVVESASDEPNSVFVYTVNRKRYEVKLLGGDSFYDVAVLEFVSPPGEEVGHLEFSNTMPYLAQRVYAIGNPLGRFPYTVTDGIISALNRVRDGLTGKFGYLQSTATTIWGNSGGPLVDEDGRVVGINSQIDFAEGPDGNTYLQQQLNFSLEPILSARIVDGIIAKGYYERAYLGMEFSQYQSMESYFSEEEEDMDPSMENVRIAGVLENAPSSALLRQYIGWTVLKLNDVSIESIEELLGELENIRPQEKASLTISNGKDTTLISVNSRRLDKIALETIARHVISKNPEMDLDNSSAQLKLYVVDDEEEEEDQWEGSGRAKWKLWSKEEKTGRIQSKWMLGAGIYSMTERDVWSITTLEDLGELLRIYGLRGGMQFFLTDNPGSDDIDIISQSFSEHEDYFAQYLWY